MNPAKVIDLEHLRRTTLGEPQLEAELFGMFREQCSLWLRALDPKGDAAMWKSATHALKGMSRGLGAFALGDACDAAEALTGDAGTPVSRSLALETLRGVMDETLEAVAKLDHRAATTFRAAAKR